ncbi:MAG: RtcB family protein [Psychrobacillus psychrotolerans]|uniref:RtcB family protein n=1 Tax=Psychrobacillus psychrotolerans TaxID=126156 RepID=UPI003BB052BF
MMKIIKGMFDTAKVFTENIDDVTMEQIKSFLDQQFVTDANVRIMPDCHAGKGAVIGTTMKIKNKIVPNPFSIDICKSQDSLLFELT